MRSFVKTLAAGVAAAAMIAAGDARAAGVHLSSDFQSGEDVKIKYTGQSGWESTTAGDFKVTPTSPSGSAFEAYCVSLGVPVGTGPTSILASQVLTLNTVTNAFFTNSNYADVGNRLAYLLTTYGPTGSDPALALAIWDTIDKNFSYKDASYSVDYWYGVYTSFSGYNAATHYASNAKLFVIDPSTPYQNLIGISSVAATPEPASLVSAAVGLGAAGLFAARRRRAGA